MIGNVPTGQHKGQPGDAERQRMRAHVPAIRQQSHGMENPPGRNFHDHHDDGQQHDAQRARLRGRRGGVEAVGMDNGISI